ncbi:MAG TPA: 16S rRNA (guanine(527)-N(7))-methyltransferase RsmG [Polyangiaceae bacterium]
MTPEPRPPLPLPAAAPLAPPPDFDERLAGLGVTLAPGAATRLGAFLALLLAMNEHVNLTAITEPTEAWSRHVLDALTLAPLLADLPAGARLLDVGSGGGVPGIPLAIARPDLHVTLLDATEKKVAFLRAVVAELGLANVDTVCGRAEDVDLGATFDVVVARGVAKLPALLGWTAPFAKRGGRLLLIKGERAEIELKEASKRLRQLRCEHERTVATPTGRILVLRVC